jgi:hypothetical protein
MADKIVLDSCAMQPEGIDLNATLYRGRKGLASVTFDKINNCIDRIGKIEELMNSQYLIVIPQVLQEIQTGLSYLNRHITYFNQMGRNKANGRATNKRERKWRDKIFDFNKGDFEEELLNLSTYSGRINQFLRRFSQDSRKIRQDDEMYQMLLEMARNKVLSGDLDSHSNSERDWMKNYTGTGANLETDKHIIATAFRLSYGEDSPITILTADGGITKLMGRMKDSLQNPDYYGFKYGFTVPLSPQVNRAWASTFFNEGMEKAIKIYQ